MRFKIAIWALLIIVCVSSDLAGDAITQQQQNRYRYGQATPAGSFYIRGKVEGLTGEIIKKAVVVLPELGISVETDEKGRFALNLIPAGKYHLEVYAEGYMEYASDPFDLTRSVDNYKITLIKKIEEQIVVTATKTPKLYAETPVKTKVITQTEIKQKVAVNLAESLSLTPGVRVENDCQNCNFTQVRINGMEGKYTQILIDGSSLVSAMTGVYELEQIPAEMIDRLEVVKGGGSVLYGGNAVAGVINIITKEPQETKTNLKFLEESISGRTYLNLNFDTSHVSSDMNTKIYLFTNYQKRDPVDLNDDGFSELGSIKNTSFGLNFFHDFQDLKAKTKVGVFRIFEERRGGNAFNLQPHQADLCEWAKSDQLGLSVEWNQTLRPDLFYNLSFSYLDAKRNTYYGSHDDPNAYGTTKNPILIGNGQLNWQAGAHVLSFGFQLKRDQINDQALGYGRVINQTYDEIGVYLQDDFKIGKKFSLLSGLRLNKHSALNHLIVTPRLSLLANLTKELTWRTTFSTGFRGPQVFDEDLHITQVGGEGMLIVNSPDLKEESSYSFTSGLDYGKQIGQNTLRLSLEGFYTRLAYTFILHEIGRLENARVMERINGSGSRVYGLSLEAGLILGSNLSLSSGWTFQNNQLDQPEPEFNCREFFRTPRSYGFANLSYKNRKWLEADLSLDYTGSMKVPHYTGYIPVDWLETSPPFVVVNLKLQKKLHLSNGVSLNLFSGIFNLFNSYQRDLDLGADRDSGYVYGPSKPRSFYGGAEFSF
jgi:outer membrane receptor for ferrienterochelin and colicins